MELGESAGEFRGSDSANVRVSGSDRFGYTSLIEKTHSFNTSCSSLQGAWIFRVRDPAAVLYKRSLNCCDGRIFYFYPSMPAGCPFSGTLLREPLQCSTRRCMLPGSKTYEGSSSIRLAPAEMKKQPSIDCRRIWLLHGAPLPPPAQRYTPAILLLTGRMVLVQA